MARIKYREATYIEMKMSLLSRSRNERLIIEFSRQTITTACFKEGKHPGDETVVVTENHKNDFVDLAGLTVKLDDMVRAIPVRTPAASTAWLPRHVVCMHVIELPPLSIEDQVSAVNMEMEAIYGEECEQFLWDFAWLPTKDLSHQYTIIFSVPKRIVDAVFTATERTQVPAEHITLSDLAYGSLYANETGLLHVLALRDDRLESLICYQGFVVQSNCCTIATDTECDFERLRGTLRRLHSSLPESMQQLDVQSRLLVIHASEPHGNHPQTTFERSLREQCQRAQFACSDRTLAELLTTSERPKHLSIDFAHPKKIVPPFINRKRKLVAAVIMATLCIVALWSAKQYEVAELKDKIAATERQITEYDQRIEEFGERLATAETLKQWDTSNVNWTEQIIAISKQISATPDVYIVRMQMDNQNHMERKPFTRIEGRAKSSKSVLEVTRALSVENKSLAVNPSGIEPNSVDPEYSSQFRLEITEADVTTLPQDQKELEN